MYLAYLPMLQAELLCGSLYGANSDFVDWRQFIVCAAQPWPRPSTQDLIDAMKQFSRSQSNTTQAETAMKDSLNSALSKPLWLNREQYMATDIWLTRGEGPQSDRSEQEGDGEKFDRNLKLKEVSNGTLCRAYSCIRFIYPWRKQDHVYVVARVH